MVENGRMDGDGYEAVPAWSMRTGIRAMAGSMWTPMTLTIGMAVAVFASPVV